jgi:NAD(P)-dependent dehydrogenase (short-subunit alcohol dehydrogenase family)
MATWTVADMPDQSDRIAVITGGNSGLGFQTAVALAAKGAHVVLAVRNIEKGNEAVARIRQRYPDASLELQRLDLGSLESVRTAAELLRNRHKTIDLLINNAGVMYPPRSVTEDGFELQFGTNHLGHFALTGLLLNGLLRVPGSRVVTVSSIGHRVRAAIHFDDLQWERSYGRMAAYGQSKLANLMFTYELQRRLSGQATVAVAAHPGGAKTELTRNTPLWIHALIGPIELASQNAAMGALPTLRAATDPHVQGGQYLGPSGLGELRGYPKVVTSSRLSHDVDVQQRLWSVSEELTGVTYRFGGR